MRILNDEDHAYSARLTDEWIQLYNADHATRDKAEKQRLYARMKEIDKEQQDMLDKANSKKSKS